MIEIFFAPPLVVGWRFLYGTSQKDKLQTHARYFSSFCTISLTRNHSMHHNRNCLHLSPSCLPCVCFSACYRSQCHPRSTMHLHIHRNPGELCYLYLIHPAYNMAASCCAWVVTIVSSLQLYNCFYDNCSSLDLQ